MNRSRFTLRRAVGVLVASALASVGFAGVGQRALADESTGAGVAVSAYALETPVLVGESLVFRTNVDNAGPQAAEDVVVTIDLDPTAPVVGVRVLDGDDCLIEELVATCSLGSMAVNEQRYVEAEFRPSATGDVTVTASVSASNAITPPEGFATTSTAIGSVVDPSVDLYVIDSTGYGPAPSVGQSSSLAFSFYNLGPSAATNIALQISVPTSLQVTAVTGDSCDITPGTISCTIGEVAKYDGRTVYVYFVAPDEPGTIAYSATVATALPERNPGDNSVSGTVEVVDPSDPVDPNEQPVRLRPTLVGPVSVYEGEIVDFTLALGVDGENPARNTTLTLQIPAQMSFYGASSGCRVGDAPTIVVCDLGDAAVTGPQHIRHVYLRADEPVHAATLSLTADAATAVAPTPTPSKQYLTISAEGDPKPLDYSVVFNTGRGAVLQGRLFMESLRLTLEQDIDDVSQNFNPVATIAIPEGLTVESAATGEAPCSIDTDAREVRCVVTGPGFVREVHMAIRADEVGSYELLASVGGAERVDPNPANDTAASRSPISVVPGTGAVRGLAGCTTNTLVPNGSDNTVSVPLPFSPNLGSSSRSAVMVNQTGVLSFDSNEYDASFPTADNIDGPFFAPFFADFDNQRHGGYAFAPETGIVSYGTTTVDDQAAFCVTWDEVADNANRGYQDTDTFQALLVDRGDGDFDIEFNYEQITIDQIDLNRPSALAGFELDDATTFTFPGVGTPGTLSDGNTVTGLIHGTRDSDGQLGRYRFAIRSGEVVATGAPDPVAPVVSLGADLTSSEGDSVAIAGIASDDDGDLSPTVTLDFGDGSSGTAAVGSDGSFSVAHAFADDDSYTVRACAQDAGALETCDELLVVTSDVAPTAPGTPSSSVASPNRGTFDLTWSPSSDVPADAVTYRLDRSVAGDASWTTVAAGLTAPSASVVTDPEGAWVYRVVAMSDGASSESADSAAIVVDRTVPVATITCPATTGVGTSRQASWSATDDRSGLATNARGIVDLDTSSVGVRSATAPAPADRAGNIGAAPTCSYEVVAPPAVATKLKPRAVLVNKRSPQPILRLSATLLAVPNTPVAGHAVSFFVDKQFVCSAVTDAAGFATCDVLAGIVNATIATRYRAEFAGAPGYLPTKSKGKLLK